MTAHHGPIPVPARITLALDSIRAEGPWVDKALGGAEPMVDLWEAGELVPTPAQIDLLSELTKYPPEWFYRPADELGGVMRTFLCDRSRKGENGLTIIRSWVDWSGVLHIEEETPPRPPKKTRKPAAQPAAAAPPKPRGGHHKPAEDPEIAGYCTCGLPLAGRNRRHLPA